MIGGGREQKAEGEYEETAGEGTKGAEKELVRAWEAAGTLESQERAIYSRLFKIRL